MRSPSVPAPTGTHVRQVFLTVNAVPLGIGVVLSCSTALTAVQVYGRLTLGVVWGVLQLVVFLGSVWWYEDRSTRLCEPGQRPGAVQPASTGRESGAVSR